MVDNAEGSLGGSLVHRDQLVGHRDHVATANLDLGAQGVERLARALEKRCSHARKRCPGHIPAVRGDQHAIADAHTHVVGGPMVSARVRDLPEPFGPSTAGLE